MTTKIEPVAWMYEDRNVKDKWYLVWSEPSELWFSRVPLFTEAQLTAAVAAERERAAKIVDPAQTPVAQIAAVEPALSVSPAEMLSLVRTTWGLNVTQAASVFRVERPTIYLWAGLQDHSRVRPQNRNRMMQLYRLAREWSQMGRLPNATLEAVFDGYPTLLEMLSAEQLDLQAILGSHARLASNRPQIDARSNERADAYGKALSSAIKSMGRRSPGKGGDPV